MCTERLSLRIPAYTLIRALLKIEKRTDVQWRLVIATRLHAALGSRKPGQHFHQYKRLDDIGGTSVCPGGSATLLRLVEFDLRGRDFLGVARCA